VAKPKGTKGAGRKPARKSPSKSRSSQPQSPLPPPEEVAGPQLVPAQPEQGSGGLFGLGNLFERKTTGTQASVADFLPSSDGFSTAISEPKPGDPLDPEAERLLARIPDRISSEPIPDAAPEGEALEPGTGGDPVSDFMAEMVFEEQDVKDALCEIFDWLAEKFDNGNWKLTERQTRILGKATFQLSTSLWSRLQQLLPDLIARWCESTPGAAAFVGALGIVVVPKAWNQVKVSRERKSQKRVAEMRPAAPKTVSVASDPRVPPMTGAR
jgi:hypothetical protein